MPPLKRKGVKENSETSGNEVEGSLMKRPNVEESSEMDVSTDSEVRAVVESRRARKKAKQAKQVSASASLGLGSGSAADAIGVIKLITGRVNEVLFNEEPIVELSC